MLTNDEVFNAIKNMNHSTSPRKDGFTGHFYLSCWALIQEGLCAFIGEFFQGPIFVRKLIRLLGDLRPISLNKFFGKTISKILAMRLAKLLPMLIDEEHASFVQKGCNIATHIVLAQELIRDLNRKATEGNTIFKLDMAKEYDRLKWRFLLRAMKAFEFNEYSRDPFYHNLCTIWYRFRINGEYPYVDPFGASVREIH